MSKQLLEAIIRLFAFFVRIDGISERERSRMEKMLTSRLNQLAVEKFMALFDELTENRPKDQLSAIDRKFSLQEVEELCDRINAELTHQQKIVITIELVQLIFADEILSAKEEDAYQKIGESLNIDTNELELIRLFVTAQELEAFNSASILIIQKNNTQIPVDCQRIITGEFHGLLAILHLQSIKTFFIRYLGNSAIFINQVTVESGGIAVFSTGSTIRGEKIPTIYYSDILGQFRMDSHEKQICFEVKNISYRFKNGQVGIHPLTFTENNGQLIGIMGASGSGKSTLINILNEEGKPTGGTVLINGINMHREPRKIKGLIGYVPQDDLLIEELTVFENLYYAACLCFRKLDKMSIIRLVDKTLGNLGLMDVKDLKVGNPLQKVISGGQRKRLNIGLELLREPMILFVDEPTSGLSSRDSENIMDLLKELSLKGKLVFTVIHQPSSDIFKMFDKLLIMDVGGYPVYYGNPVEAVVYFKARTNILDRQTGSCPECGNINPEQIFNIIETRMVDEFGNITDRRKTMPATWYEYYQKYIKIPEAEKISELPVLFSENSGKIQTITYLYHKGYKIKTG